MQIVDAGLKFRNKLNKRSRTEYIVLHHAAALKCSPADIHRWHLERGWAGAGYHYLVRKDGTVYSLRPEDTVGAHCEGYNSRSIGVCAEGNFDVEQMEERQRASLHNLVRYLKDEYPEAKIVGHRELAATNCPGKNYPLEEIKKAAEKTWIDDVKDTVLKRTSRGDTVKRLQEALKQLGFNPGSIDGIFGPKTQAAVKAFQQKYGLTVDGIVGPQTWGKINQLLNSSTSTSTSKPASTPLLKNGSRGEDVRRLQEILKQLGFDPGPIDGIFGPKTEAAVKAFQKKYGLVVDGIVGPQTWRKLAEVIR